jgi:hypothetical protein
MELVKEMSPPGHLDTRHLLHFTDFYQVDPVTLARYGAFNISLVSDLPFFVDPFLLFNSDDPTYQGLHESIIKYVMFLRDKAIAGIANKGLIKNWFHFKEVKQNWLGFTEWGNGGSGLGPDFANSLNRNLGRLFSDEDNDDGVTEGRHVEKISLIKDGVGRDGISDFTTNLIKGYLLSYTQTFTLGHIAKNDRRVFRVPKANFNYKTESWMEGAYTLPSLGDGPEDFVLLTPTDILTRDDTWISRADLVHSFQSIPIAIPDPELRAQVENYLKQRLRPSRSGKAPTQVERTAAIQETIEKFPEVLDYYIALKELNKDAATSISSERIEEANRMFVELVRRVVADMANHLDLPKQPPSSYMEALERVLAFKQYVENQDGYKLVNPKDRPFSQEKDVQLFFGLALIGSSFDVNREPNNGRGPVDYKISRGAFDKSLIEFKLGSNRSLKRNLQNQVEIYEKANQTATSVKVIVNYTREVELRVLRILKELKIQDQENIVLIDARRDNKPSASKA